MNGNNGRVFDLQERTAKYGENIIKFCKTVHKSNITNPLISQLVRSATSVGANYCEADNAVSKKDFRNKIGICKKESMESKFFLRMLQTAAPEVKSDCEVLANEAKELNLIFNKIFIKTK